MTMHPVESSNIKAIGYDSATKTLRVQFTGSGTYDFSDVSPSKHAALMKAKSKGKHFAAHIRHDHDFTRLEEE